MGDFLYKQSLFYRFDGFIHISGFWHDIRLKQRLICKVEEAREAGFIKGLIWVIYDIKREVSNIEKGKTINQLKP